MEKKCEVCEKIFEAERMTARYCSGACRAKADRISARSDSAREVSVRLPDVTLDDPCHVTNGYAIGDRVLDLEKDLKLDLKKDLGIFSWTRDGIMIRPDITIKQVQNIARLIHAKHGRACPEFKECL